MKLILLIDDDGAIRLSFGLALRSRGYRVIESDSGEGGLELARQQMPDLILTDINMPGGDGQTLLQQIRADPELSGAQVVLMTGRPDLVPPRRGMDQGADDFLVKPISGEALFSCVEARLSRGDVHWRVEDRILSKLRSSVNSKLPHEFITPLAGILGLSELLKTDFSNLSVEEMHDFHNDIHQSAMRLYRTIKNYLLMLELESETKEETSPKEFAPLTQKALEDSLKTGIDRAVERHGRKEDITLRVEQCSVLVSASDLAQMVEELVDNALKFSRAGSPIDLRFESIGVLSVTDAGRGMLAQEIEEIGAFQQFERKKYEQQGLGVGLVLVQKLAARNGATLTVTCRPDQGIQDRITFQVANHEKSNSSTCQDCLTVPIWPKMFSVSRDALRSFDSIRTTPESIHSDQAASC
jgi:two-component system sensor histidine kinase/response regulator